MSDLQKTIEIIFSGVDELSGPMNSMSGDITDFSARIESMAAPLAKAGDAVLKIDAALVTLATTGLVLAAKQAGEFSGSMAEVNTLLNVSGAEYLNLRDDVLAYATGSTAALSDLTGALYQLISMGVDYKDSVKALETIEYAATAGRADMVSTTETLIGTMNAYGAGMEEITRYSDAYFTIIKNGKTTLPELAGSLADVTGIAALAGVPFETLGAAVAALTAAGTPTSQAVTQIKAAIQALIAPTEGAIKAAADLGIEIGASAVKSKGFEVVLNEIYEAAKGNPEVINEIIPSIRGLAAVAVLGADSAGLFSKSIGDMSENTGATVAAFEKMKDNLDQVWQNMLTNLNVAFVRFGLEFEGETTDLVKAVSSAFESIGVSVNMGNFDPILDAVRVFGREMTDLINDIAASFPEAMSGVDFSDLLRAMGEVGTAIESIFDGVDLRTPEGLQRVMQNVIDTMETLARVTAGMIESWKPFIDGIVGGIQSLNNMDEAAQKNTGNLLGIAQAITTFGVEMSIAILAIGDAAGRLGPILTGVANLVGGVLDLIVMGWISLKVGVMEMAEEILWAMEKVTFGSLSDTIAENRNVISGWKDAAISDLQAAGSSALKNLTGIEVDFQKLGQTVEGAKGDVSGFTGELELIPSHKSTEISTETDVQSFHDHMALMNEIPEELQTNAEINPDEAAAKNTKDVLDGAAPSEKTTDAKVVPNLPSIQSTQSAINQIPESRLLEIELQGDIDIKLAEIEALANTVQTAFEWNAKVDIANVEADAKRVVAAFDAASEAVTATAAAAADMYGSLLDNWEKLGWVEKRVFEEYLREQMAMEQQALDMQQALTEAQVNYMNARTEALRSGEGLIKIESDGLEPALELIMWQILEKVQLRVNEESAEFLLGLNT